MKILYEIKMTSVLITLHIIVTLSMIGLILLQKSEGGGFGSSHPGMGSLFSVRGKTDFLSRTTAILATMFIALSFILAIMASRSGSIISTVQKQATTQEQHAPVSPSKPEVPIGSQNSQ